MQFECDNCANIFEENEKNLDFKPFSNFRSPCQSTYKICKHVEKYLNFFDIRRSTENYDFKVIYCLLFRTLDLDTLFKNSSFSCNGNHKYQIIKWIIKKYIDKKCAHLSNEMTLDQYDKIFRQQLNKLIIFAGQ